MAKDVDVDLTIDVRDFERWVRSRLPGSVSIDHRLNVGVELRQLNRAARSIRVIAQSEADGVTCTEQLHAAGFARVADVWVMPSLAGIGRSDGIELASTLDLGLRLERGDVRELLDTRTRSEWARGHVVGARNAWVAQQWSLLRRRVSRGFVWVYGRQPARAALAASVVAEGDRPIVVVEEAIGHAGAPGLPWCSGQSCMAGVCTG